MSLKRMMPEILLILATLLLLTIDCMANDPNNSSVIEASAATTLTQTTALATNDIGVQVMTAAATSESLTIQSATRQKTVDPKEDSLPEAQLVKTATERPANLQGKVLNSVNGTVEGPSGKETYYNLDMSGVIKIMQNLGYDYEYHVREDGVKMYGPYVMCAANLELRPRGTLVETTLGMAIVCDTGSFAKSNPTQIDIAVNW